ncbi:PAS domain S-box-containing protein [Salsuginibacillus halophilus]|uniref:PAS domain S-box-containing protein n=1 Tax=Salsuginibacillus halophilus TaxID=517424 RepID=A0A2P8H3S3_9BACI|nr:STAS domain-containing protein [Salsuginibacillus halophilus]PSL40866.1 PAS domain S-box-containing protein [Salsuginibacillus halophilus]
MQKFEDQNLRFILRAIDHTKVGVVVTDPEEEDNPIIYGNQGFIETTGYEPDEFLNRNCRFLQGEDTDPATIAHIKDKLVKKEPVSVEIYNYRKNGEGFWNELNIDPIYIEEEGKWYFVGVQKDITKQKQAENRLDASLQEIQTLSTPVVPVEDGVAVLPLIGTMTSERFHQMLEHLPDVIANLNEDFLIVDMSGLQTIDGDIMEGIFKLHHLMQLLGTQLLVTGMSPRLAMEAQGAPKDLSTLTTYRNVKEALRSLTG